MPETTENTRMAAIGVYDPNDPQQIINGAEETSLFEEVAQQLASERAQHPVDPYYARRNETWAFLAHKVVGQEKL